MKKAMPGTIDWRRLIAESLAIVASILLAFAIDAWWDGHKERLHERELLAGLLEDFQSSRPGLESRAVLARRMATGTALLLEATDPTGGAIVVTVPDTLILAAIGGPTYEPDMNTLDAAVASGEIELLSSGPLRAELATWRRNLSDTAEDEIEVRRITNEQLVPALARSIDLRPLFDDLLRWSGGDPYAAGRRIREAPGSEARGRVRVAVSTELIGALSLRQFYVEFSAADLEELLATLDRAVALIEAEQQRGR